jgi:hypothetical protein
MGVYVLIVTIVAHVYSYTTNFHEQPSVTMQEFTTYKNCYDASNVIVTQIESQYRSRDNHNVSVRAACVLK